MPTGITISGSTGAAGETDMATQETARGGSQPTTLIADGLPGNVRMNGRGEALIAAAQTERSEIVRIGSSWHYSIPTGSAFTTVAAWPTTRSELNLTNMNAAGGQCIVIDEVWAATTVTETAASALTILCQVSPVSLVASAAVVDNSAVLARCLNGKAGALNRAPGVAATIASTAYGIASQWHVVNQNTTTPLGAVSVGQSSVAKINGLYIIPPTATFAVNVVVGTAVATSCIMGIVFHLMQLDLGA